MSMELSTLELDAENGELLPAREALGIFKFNLAGISATNTSVALNTVTFGSYAGSQAVQAINVIQR